MSRAARAKAREQSGDLLSIGGAEGELKVGDKVTGHPDGEMKIVATSKPTKAAKAKTEVAKVTQLPAPAAKTDLVSSLWHAITDASVDPGKVTVLQQLREKLMQEQAHVQFMSAYIEMQAELPSISRDGKIDQGVTKSGREGVKARWATFENINATIRPLLVKHKMGLLLLPDAGPDGTGIVVRGQLGYVCDTDYGKTVHVERCTIPVPSDPTGGKSPPQGVGAALSYGKRYGTIALLNIVSHAPEDADTDAKRRPKEVEEAKLTADEVKRLKAALEFCGATEAEFCKFYKIEKVEKLPPNLFAEAMDACRRRAEGNAEKKGG